MVDRVPEADAIDDSACDRCLYDRGGCGLAGVARAAWQRRVRRERRAGPLERHRECDVEDLDHGSLASRHLRDVGDLHVDPGTQACLQDEQVIRDEATSWLAGLDATVHGVNIRKADS